MIIGVQCQLECYANGATIKQKDSVVIMVIINHINYEWTRTCML